MNLINSNIRTSGNLSQQKKVLQQVEIYALVDLARVAYLVVSRT
jgi:hypothetical protein